MENQCQQARAIEEERLEESTTSWQPAPHNECLFAVKSGLKQVKGELRLEGDRGAARRGHRGARKVSEEGHLREVRRAGLGEGGFCCVRVTGVSSQF